MTTAITCLIAYTLDFPRHAGAFPFRFSAYPVALAFRLDHHQRLTAIIFTMSTPHQYI